MRRVSLIAVLLACALPCQGEKQQPKQKPVKIEQLAEWPALTKPKLDHLLGCLKQFRKEDAKLHEGAHNRIVAIGGTGQYLPLFGDDALANSCEIFLPPDAGPLTTQPLP